MLNIYSDLMEKGHSISDIDNMDAFLYLDILVYKYKNSSNNKNEEFGYIDQNPYI